MANIEYFTISKEGFQLLRNRMLGRYVPVMILLTTLPFLVFNYQHISLSETGDFKFYFLGFTLLILTVGIFRSVKKLKAFCNSYVLKIGDNQIIREQYDTDVISLSFDEISDIVKFKSGRFMIRGKGLLNMISIPKEIDQYERLEQVLNDIQPIQTKSAFNPLQIAMVGLPISYMALLFGMQMSKDKLVVGICGTICILLIALSIYMVQISKNVDNRTKSRKWVSIILLVAVALNMYVKIFLEK